MTSRQSQQHLWSVPVLGMGGLSLCSFIGYRDSQEPSSAPFVIGGGFGS